MCYQLSSGGTEHKDNFIQVSLTVEPLGRHGAGKRGWRRRYEASKTLARVMRDIQTLSAVAETEVAFKDYRSLA